MNAQPAPSLIADMFSAGQRAARRPSVAKVIVLDRMADAAAAWAALEECAPATPYQSFALNEIWLDTIGRSRGISLAIIVAEDAEGRPVALLPLGVSRQAGLRCAAFLGGHDFNGNLGLFDPAVAWDRGAILALLAQGAAQAGIDVFHLKHQPAAWAGIVNPLWTLGGQPSPSSGHAARLTKDPDAFFAATQSKHARKMLRYKRNKLEAIGEVSHQKARTRAEAETILAAYLAQKSVRLAQTGIPAPRSPGAFRSFLEQAVDPETSAGPLVELHALLCGDRIVATFGGTGRSGRFSGMFISFENSTDVARWSPGDLLLAHVIAEKCRQGFASFDLGIGEARYKETFCPEVEPMFDQFLGMTSRGKIAASLWSMLVGGKRQVKQTPWLWSAAQRGRKMLARAQAVLTRPGR